MEFKIIYGRSGCGKTSYIFNEIKEKIKGSNKIYIIVPEQFSFSAENKQRCVSVDTVTGGRVVAMHGFAGILWCIRVSGSSRADH